MSPKRRSTLIKGIASIILTYCALSATAQGQAYFGVFFDEFLTEETKDCPGLGVPDTLHVGLLNSFGSVASAEYQVVLPSSMLFIADLHDDDAIFWGESISGVGIGFPGLRNGLFPVRIQRILIEWNCTDCTGHEDGLIVVKENPLGPWDCPSWEDWPYFGRCAIGLTTIVCPDAIATERTTWGKVKSLYYVE